MRKAARPIQIKAFLYLSLIFTPGIFSSCAFPDLFLINSSSNQKPVAIFFGLADYPAAYNDLQYTTNDARLLEEIFSSEGWETYLFTDADCTAENFTNLINELSKTSEEDRLILFSYSGHGVYSSNADGTGEASLVWLKDSSTLDFISPEDLAELCTPLFEKSLRTVFLLDACYSGDFSLDGAYVDTLAWNYSSNLAYSSNSSFSDDLRAVIEWLGSAATAESDDASSQAFDPEQVWTLSASGSQEESWEYKDSFMDEGHGVFTWYIAQGLSQNSDSFEADLNLDGKLSLRELYRYAYSEIQEQWNEVLKGSSAEDYEFLPHISGNYTDIILLTR